MTTKKDQLKKFSIRKIVEAVSIDEALIKEKKIRPCEIIQMKKSKDDSFESLIPAIGFAPPIEAENN